MASEQLERVLARSLGAAWAWVLPAGVDEVRDGLVQAVVGRTWYEATEGEGVGLEPLGACPVACHDLKGVSAAARGQGQLLLVDLSLMGPLACAAVRLGADAAVAAYAGGWSVVGVGQELLRTHPSIRPWLDACAARTLPEGCDPAAHLEAQARWWRTTSDAAQVLASYLRCHPRVGEVRYPGLKTDPSFVVAARTLVGGFGPLVDYRLAGEARWQRIHCTDEDPRMQVMQVERALAIAVD